MQCHNSKYLVVDTSAFISSVALHKIGERVCTIPEVIDEVRSKRQFRRIASLTYDIEIKTVFDESIAVEFAKKTGDYASLSLTDIKLLALTYQLETHFVGHEHIRASPVVKEFSTNINIKRDQHVNNALCLPVNIEECDRRRSQANIIRETDDRIINGFDDSNLTSEDPETVDEADFKECGKFRKFEDYDTADEFSLSKTGEELSSEEYNNSSQSEDDESTVDNSWITPRNLSELQRSIGSTRTESVCVTVACLTTDFAIQNVLLQMGLNVLAVDGKLIKELRTFILRCYACYKTTTNMRKVFCPNCGNKTLKRVSVFVDKNGNKCMFINFKKNISTRGKRFSLPMPKGGKHAINPRLVEDARRPHQKASKLARMKTNALAEDYIAGWSPFVMRDVQSKSAQLGFNKGKQVVKYWMRKNPNESKRMAKK